VLGGRLLKAMTLRWFGGRRGVLAVGALLLISACEPRAGSHSCARKFDSVKWRQAPRNSRERKDLAAAIERCGYVKGRTKNEVARLLGRAPRDETQSRADYRREWRYFVGQTNGTLGPPDDLILVVRFDRDGRVTQAYVAP
jgi:hypothetical protein